MATDILAQALDYAGRGWCVLPLRAGEKVPSLPSWQTAASNDEAQIESWWTANPSANLGVQLGPRSGIIDVECDTKDAELSLWDLFGGELPITPTFSAKRGKHRLFKWRGDLPAIAVVKVKGVEFRLGGGDKGAQSVFPPSTHPDGPQYKWLVGPDDAPLGIITDEIRNKIFAAAAGRDRSDTGGATQLAVWSEIEGGVEEGNRNQSAAKFIGVCLHDLRDVSDNGSVRRVWATVVSWNERNRPPLPDAELKATFNSILRRARESALKQAHESILDKYIPIEAVRPTKASEAAKPAEPVADGTEKSAETTLPGWKLWVMDTDPRSYKIQSPLWPGKNLIIPDSASLLTGFAMRKAALEQADVYLGPDFNRAWEGTAKARGIASILMEVHEVEDADPDLRRPVVVARAVLNYLAGASPYREGGRIDGLCTTEDGSIACVVNEAMRAIEFDLGREDRIKRPEMTALLSSIGATDFRPWDGGSTSRKRFKLISKEAMKKLRLRAEDGDGSG